jgi:hypothetical protein
LIILDGKPNPEKKKKKKDDPSDQSHSSSCSFQKFLEVRKQPLVGFFQVLGNDPHLGQSGHEIRISLPAGNNVKMKVVENPGSGNLPQIHSHVEAIGMKSIPQDFNRSAHMVKKICHLFFLQFLDLIHVPHGGNHDVGVGVRVSVEHDQGKGSLVEDQPFLNGLTIHGAKDASLPFLIGQDVFHSPWGP